MKNGLMIAGLALGLAACNGEAAGAEEDSGETAVVAEDLAVEAEPEVATQEEAPSTSVMSTIPDRFHGGWDDPESPAKCGEGSYEFMRIEAEGIGFSEAYAYASRVELVDTDTLVISATMETYDGESDEEYRMTLRDGGERLEMQVTGLPDAFSYDRCPDS